MSSDLNITGEVVVSTEKVDAAFDRVGDKAGRMATDVASAAGRAGQAVDGIGSGVDQTAQKFTRAESSIIASIKRSTKELELMGKTASQRIEFNIAEKGLDPTKFDPILQRLREMEAQAAKAQAAAVGALDKTGISAAQTAAAMRQVPAQFTDIITSLQGGQKPMTVLLQQGGQLKDMFGGAGNAAKAMGTYVLGLANPLTITAGAAGVLLYAFLQGQKEAQAYRQALIETGNAAGVTATQLAAMAASVATSSRVTQGLAAESLAALAGTNNIASGSFERIAGLASQLQSVTGASVGATVKQFEELGKSPVEASLKLNETTHFLTASVYEQIKALAEQGKTSEAAAVAQNAYASAMEQRIPQLQANLGYVEKAWAAITKEAKGAWDAMLNVGRPTDPLAGAKSALDAAQAALDRARDKAANGGLRDTSKENADANVARLERVVAARQQEVAALSKGAGYEAQSAAYQKIITDEMEAQVKLSQMADKYLSNEKRMRREIAAAREIYNNSPKDAASTKALNASIAGIREQYAGEGPRTALDAIIRQLEEQQMVITQAEQRAAKTLAAQHAAQLIDDADFYAKKRDMALQSVAEQQAIIQGEIAAVAKSGIKSGDKTKEIERYNGELAKLRQQALGIESDYADGLIAIAAKERKIQDDYITSLGKAGASESKRLDAAIAAQREHNATIGMSKEQIEIYKKSIQDAEVVELEAQYNAINAMLEKNQALLDYGDTLGLIGVKSRAIYEEERKNLQDQITKRKILAADMASGAEKEAAVAVAKAAEEEWKRGWNETDRLARDVFTTWATEGGNAAQKIGDTLKKALLSAIYEVTLKPVVLQIYSSFAGGGGAAGTAAQLASGGNMLGSLGSAGSWLSGLSSFGGQFASGFSGSAAAAAELMGGAELTTAASLGSMAATVMPWLAGAAVLKSLTDYSVKSDGSALVANIGAKGLSGEVARRDDFTQSSSGILSGGTTHNSDWSRAGDAVDSYINTITKSATTAVHSYAAALGLPVEAIDGFTKQIEVSITGLDAAGQKAAIDKAVGTFISDMVGSAYGDALKGLAKEGESSGDTLARLATDLTGVNAMFATLHETLLPVGVAGASAAAGLADVFGGLDKMQSAVGAYYEKFYTDAEKAANGLQVVDDGFAKLGISVPKSKQEFRALVDSIDVTTESGRKLYASVISLAPAFDQASASAQAAANNMLSAVQNWGTSADVRQFKASQLQQTFANAGYQVDMGTILGATKDSVLSYFNSLDASSPIKKILYENQQAIYDLVSSGQGSSGFAAAASGGGGGTGGASFDTLANSAVDSIAQAWQSITDSIWGEVQRIRGLLDGTGAEGLAAAQAKFDIANVMALAGDQNAAKALPDLSKNLLTLAEANASTLVELRILQAQVSGKLSDTAGQLAAQYGLTIPAFAGGGLHSGGWAMVGEQGPELAYLPPARIYTAADTSALLGGGSADMVAELQALRAELAELRASQARTTAASEKTASILNTVTLGGAAMQTQTA